MKDEISILDKYPHIASQLFNEPWLIQEDYLEKMITIVKGMGDIKAVQTKLSSQLTGAEKAGVRDGVAVIPVSGPIFPKANLFTQISGATSISSLARDFQIALDDDSVNSIILDVDSPGGAVTGVNEMADIIRAGSEQKDVTAYVSGTGASAAYWLASAASEVVIDATARVGSIGVVVAYPGKDEEDISVELWNTASPKKRVDVSTDEGKKTVVAELDALADVFITAVAEHRDTTPGTVVSDFGKGGVLVGKNAVNVGMVDRLGSLEGLIAEKSNTINDDGGFVMAEEKVVITADSLKASDPNVYEAIMELGKKEGVASGEQVVASKDSEISDLKEVLASSDERLKALEKTEVIRAEREMKVVAASIVSDKLNASTVPTRLHEKIHATLGYGKFVAEGKLNTVDYSEFVAVEVADWESNLVEDSIQGFSSAPAVLDGAAMETGVDDIVSRMAGSAGQTIQ